jgi:hypothetical protein
MKSRFIAALMLAMLALGSVPRAWAASSSATQAKSAAGHDHSCCPKVHSRFVPPVFVKPGPASMPCGDQHPCCAKQGPENPPSLPATTRLAAPGSDGMVVAIADQLRDEATLVAMLASDKNPLRSYSARSTVLRF